MEKERAKYNVPTLLTERAANACSQERVAPPSSSWESHYSSLCAVSSHLTIKKVSKLMSHLRSPTFWALKWQARGWEQTKVC